MHLLRVTRDSAALYESVGDVLRPLGELPFAEMPSAIDLSAAEPWVCWRDANHDACWSWRPGTEPEQLAARGGTRDGLAVGFIETEAEPLLAVARGAELRLFDVSHSLRASIELRRPHAWNCHRFTTLAGRHIAITGNLFSDPLDMIITVALQDLLRDSLTVQRAIEEGRMVHDRAEKLLVGSGPDATAVVIRDPGDEEPLEDKDDDTSDVWALRGYYVRGLSDARLVGQGNYRGAFEKQAAVVATDRVVAIEVAGSVDVIDRRDSTVSRIRGDLVALDPVNARVGVLNTNGDWRVFSLEG